MLKMLHLTAPPPPSFLDLRTIDSYELFFACHWGNMKTERKTKNESRKRDKRPWKHKRKERSTHHFDDVLSSYENIMGSEQNNDEALNVR